MSELAGDTPAASTDVALPQVPPMASLSSRPTACGVVDEVEEKEMWPCLAGIAEAVRVRR